MTFKIQDYQKIPTFQECMDIVSKCEGFTKSTQIRDGVTYHSFKYAVSFKGMWDDTSDGRLNMRGITFREEVYGDHVEYSLVALPFPKFFNLGENDSSKVDLRQAEVFYEKIDGSLVTPIRGADGEIIMKTMRSIDSDVALVATEELADREDIKTFIREIEEVGEGLYTIMFEFVSPQTRIVLRYPEPDFYFLGLRCLVNGKIILPHNEELSLTLKYYPSIKTPRAMNYEEAVEHVNEVGVEGVVATMSNGMMVKSKSEDYFIKHKTISDFSKKFVIECILSNTIDDIVSLFVQQGEPEKVVYCNEAIEKFSEFYLRRMAIVREHQAQEENSSRKEIGLKYMTDPEKMWIGVCLFNDIDKKDYIPLVKSKAAEDLALALKEY